MSSPADLVESHKVVIAIGLIDLEDLAKLRQAVEALEPIVRSITWD